MEQDIYYEAVYQDITVKFIGRDSGIELFGGVVYMNFIEGTDHAFLILHFKKNRDYLTGSGRPAAAGDFFPVFFGLSSASEW